MKNDFNSLYDKFFILNYIELYLMSITVKGG